MTQDAPNALTLPRTAVDLLFPLHVCVDAEGKISSAGPTMQRIFRRSLVGTGFFDVFTVKKPRNVVDPHSLQAAVGMKLAVSAQPDAEDPVQFRCVAVAGDGAAPELMIDFSLGIDMISAFDRFQISGADFKPNDVSVDLFFTFQTQKALLLDSQRMAAELAKAKQEAEEKAVIDMVTGIGNRRALHDRLDAMLQGEDPNAEHALLHIDLDKFKPINDVFGHAVGDAVLQHTAAALKEIGGPGDFPARIGGDEFALVLAQRPDDRALQSLADQVIASISRPIRKGENTCQVGASIGVVKFGPGTAANADRLLVNSDIALYASKDAGQTATILTPAMIARHEETADLISQIETGIARRQFVPYFQPQIDLRTMTLRGVEVLARWHHPERGVLGPGVFLETAERARLMEAIDWQVIHSAVRAFANWQEADCAVGKLSFNLTAANLYSADFTENLLDALFEANISTNAIQLELLESILFDHSDQMLAERCRSLRDAGFGLALDDFGTGHASIATLIDAPITMLKIDRSFVRGLDRNAKLQRITKSILAMAGQLGLEVLAEGVETQAELASLEEAGCDCVQGFYFSQARSERDIIEWITAWRNAQRVLRHIA